MTATQASTPFKIPELNTPTFRQLLQQCVHCGLCLQVCPTYSLFGTEMDSPRGRISLMRAAAAGYLSREEFTQVFNTHISLCLACRSCETACPSGVKYGRLVEGARVALEAYRQPGWVERQVRRVGMNGLMTDLPRFKRFAGLLRFYQKSGLQRLVRTVNILPRNLQAMEAILPPLPAAYMDYSQPAPAQGEKRGVVAFSTAASRKPSWLPPMPPPSGCCSATGMRSISQPGRPAAGQPSGTPATRKWRASWPAAISMLSWPKT